MPNEKHTISVSLGARDAYLSNGDGIVLFQSADAGVKFIQATRPDLAEAVEVGELVGAPAAGRPGDPALMSIDRKPQP
jgi:hypothetical protein